VIKMDDETDGMDDEDGSLAHLRRMLRAAEERICIRSREEIVELLHRIARGLDELGLEDISKADSGRILDQAFFRAGRASRDGSMEEVIEAAFDVVKCCAEETTIIDSVFTNPRFAQITQRIPAAILDVVLIREILNLVLQKPVDDGHVPHSVELHNLYRLGTHFLYASPCVNAAAEEGFIALAEMTLGKFELADNKGFEAMTTYIIQVARSHERLGGKNGFLDRTVALVEELRGTREHMQRESELAEILAPKGTEGSTGRVPRLYIDPRLPDSIRIPAEEGFRRAVEKMRITGELVDAPAFEKRPVPKPETPNGKTPKPVKR